MIRFHASLTNQKVSLDNINKVLSILQDYDDLVNVGSKTETPILFVTRNVQEADIVSATRQMFYPRLLNVFSQGVYFEFWHRQQRQAKWTGQHLFSNSLVNRIWFDARDSSRPIVQVLMERGDFDMRYIRSVNYPHDFKDVYR